MKFSIGDIVRRINSSHMGMKPGDIAKVINVTPGETILQFIYLDNFGGGHSKQNFELVKTDWKTRYRGAE